MKKPFPSRLRFMPVLTLALGLASLPVGAVRAADHGDAPSVDHDSGADLADAFLFLDPNDNNMAVIAMTVHGFIVPGEALNFATFDPKVEFDFEIENTGDAKPDKKIHVTFSEKTSATSTQTAHVSGSGLDFDAPTTASTLAATPNPQTVTTNAASGISFFAGPVDDPFFFDLVAFNRFVASVKAGAPDATVFNRGRDTFAGYNILAIALRVPVGFLKGSAPAIGLDARTKRQLQAPSTDGGYLTEGKYVAVDRTGNPAVNVALIPFARKDEYNAANTKQDAAGKFAGDIVASLKSLGTNDTFVNALAGVAVSKGDFLRLSLTIPNTGTGGGSNVEAGFPNGRRLGDDVIDTILTFVANGTPLGDKVNSSDLLPQSQFPFFALPHQPLDTGATDSTMN